MKPSDSQHQPVATDEWEQRRVGNKRLGYLFGAIVLAIFLGSIWKYRPF